MKGLQGFPNAVHRAGLPLLYISEFFKWSQSYLIWSILSIYLSYAFVLISRARSFHCGGVLTRRFIILTHITSVCRTLYVCQQRGRTFFKRNFRAISCWSDINCVQVFIYTLSCRQACTLSWLATTYAWKYKPYPFQYVWTLDVWGYVGPNVG